MLKFSVTDILTKSQTRKHEKIIYNSFNGNGIDDDDYRCFRPGGTTGDT